MATILYGKLVKEKIKEDLIGKIEKLGKKPVLAILQVGDREDSSIYIKQKQKFGEEIGVEVVYKKFSEDIKEEELIQEIEKINQDESVDGMIIQLPLPENLDREKVLGSIKKEKDADGLTPLAPLNLRGEPDQDTMLVTPATARAVMSLLDFYKIEIRGKRVAVIGRSKLAGGPIAESLAERGAKVKVFHKESDIEEMKKGCRESDILVSAAGQAGLITKEFVNSKQVVIDVGINRAPFQKIVGDVNFSEVEPLIYAITPVPGGIGPLTVACLFQNLLDLIKDS
jgi:methylenetetrahydrofolate dehydrogenase (NADP+) / methenyltetrahydrofolate cyclohydrolase